MNQKKSPAIGRPPKGASAKAKVIQVRVDSKLEQHVKSEGGSAFVRNLIEKSMKKSTTPKKAAIVNGPKPQAVSDAMSKLKGKTTPPKVKEISAEVGEYRKAAIKEGAKPKPTAPKSVAKPKSTQPKKK